MMRIVALGFQFCRAKLERNGEGGRENIGTGCCSIGIWDRLFGKNSSFFEDNFPIVLLSSNSNTSIFKVCGVLHWVHFLVMIGLKCLNIIHTQFFFLILYTLRASLLLSSSNDASADIVDDEDSFEFSPKVEFTTPLYFHITIATNIEAVASWFAQLFPYSQNIWKLLTFKCFLNDVLLETEWSKIMLIWWLVSIKCITSFSKFSFLISFFKRFPY